MMCWKAVCLTILCMFEPKVDLLEDPVLISEVMFQRVICLASQHSLIPILGMPELTPH